MAGDKLTPKQEAFARAYVETTNASEAYRRAYNAENMTPETLKVEACRTLALPNVSLTVANLFMEAHERTLVTVESISKELDEAREMARSTNNSAAFTGAVMGKAKVNGLLVDKVDVKAAFNVTIAGDDAEL